MLSFTGGLKVFVALEPVDLRKSFSGLEGLVSERLGEDLRQGALFVFTNRRHTRLKIPSRLLRGALPIRAGRFPQRPLMPAAPWSVGAR